jgi:hypothetical protein
MVGFIDDASRCAWGRADLQTCCRSPRPPTMIIWPSGPIRPGCRIVRAGTRRCGPRSGASSRRTGGLRRAQGLAAAAPRGLRCRPLHGREADEGHGYSRHYPGQAAQTTIPDKKQPCPLDKVNRQFRVPAPNMLWVSDFTYVATWKGFVYVAFVIDAYARKIVGWRVSTSAHAGFVLDALEQAVHERRPERAWGWSTTATAAANICPSNTPNGWPKQASNPRSAASATAMTTPGRDDQRPVQGRGHPPSRPVAQLRGRRIRHPRMGRLVQQPPPARAHREHPARRSRGQLLRSSGN